MGIDKFYRRAVFPAISLGELVIDGVIIPGGKPQGTYEGSDTQNYDIGARRVTADGRVFRYGKCYSSLSAMNVGCKNYRCLVSKNDNICKAALEGAKTIEVTTDNFTITGAKVAKDELRGGYISLYRSNDRQQRLILGNTVVPTLAGATCILTLADALVTAINLGDNCEISANPYDELIVGNHNYTAVMGMPTRLALTGEYFWIQTWGPYRVSPEGAGYGDAENQLHFVFGSTGGIITHKEGELYADYSKQHAGFVMERSNLEVGSVAPFIMLQISP